MGGKKSSKAPAPDPQIGEAAKMQAAISAEWLDFAKEQYGVANERQVGIDDLAKRVTDQQLGIQDQANKWAGEDRAKLNQWADEDRAKYNNWADQDRAKYTAMADEDRAKFNQWAERDRNRYQNVFEPLENRYVEEAANWDSQGRLDKLSNEAKADVLNASNIQRQTTARQMSAMGVNPNSGRFAGANRATDIATALSSAGAQNQARDRTRMQAMDLRANAINMGKPLMAQALQEANMGTAAGYGAASSGLGAAGLGSQTGLGAAGLGSQTSLGAAGLGISSGSSALNGRLAANANWAAAGSIMGQGFQGAANGYANQANILNNQYGNQLQAWAVQNQSNASNTAGIMGGIGSFAGMFMSSSKDVKENKEPVEGALGAIRQMPVERWDYKEGEGDGGNHIGPYAEDFQKATGQGDGKTIPVVDAMGVMMKGIQELDQKFDKLASRKKPARKARAS